MDPCRNGDNRDADGVAYRAHAQLPQRSYVSCIHIYKDSYTLTVAGLESGSRGALGVSRTWGTFGGPSQRQVSTAGGTRPRWSDDGVEFFCCVEPDTLMVVSVQPSSELTIGSPRVVVHGDYAPFPGSTGIHCDVSPNGQRFPMIRAPTKRRGPSNIVLNWFEELKERVPVP